MYAYRKMNEAQRRVVVAERERAGRPWHRLQHLVHESKTYLITAACFEHRAVLNSAARRDEYSEKLFAELRELPECEVFSWCVLPNHYHFLARLDIDLFAAKIARLHNGTSTQWNREDGTPGRQVWYQFSDRAMRSERHFWVTMNYVHANPVKHGHVLKAAQWNWCSAHDYLENWGREALQDLWREYPVRDYGKGWDD